MTVRLLLARAALVTFMTLAFVTAPSIGHLAIQEGNWPARAIMLTILVGTLCSYFAAAAARDHARRAARRHRMAAQLNGTAVTH